MAYPSARSRGRQSSGSASMRVPARQLRSRMAAASSVRSGVIVPLISPNRDSPHHSSLIAGAQRPTMAPCPASNPNRRCRSTCRSRRPTVSRSGRGGRARGWSPASTRPAVGRLPGRWWWRRSSSRRRIPKGLDDSKKLTAPERERLYDLILEKALVSVVVASRARVDRMNILRASLWGMSRAVAGLPVRPDHVLVDGNMLPPGLPCPAEAIVGGDALSVSIAAASIVAKVTRDRLMVAGRPRLPRLRLRRAQGLLHPRPFRGARRPRPLHPPPAELRADPDRARPRAGAGRPLRPSCSW